MRGSLRFSGEPWRIIYGQIEIVRIWSYKTLDAQYYRVSSLLKAVSEKVAEIIQDEIFPSPEVVVQTEVVVQNQELEKFGHR